MDIRPARRLFSRVVIFTRARVSPALLSLRKNGDYSKSIWIWCVLLFCDIETWCFYLQRVFLCFGLIFLGSKFQWMNLYLKLTSWCVKRKNSSLWMKSIKVRLTRLNRRCPVKSPESRVAQNQCHVAQNFSQVARILLGVLHVETEVNKECVYNKIIACSLHHLETKQIA